MLLPRTASSRAGDEVEVVLRLGDRVAGHRCGQRDGDRHADCEPGVQEAERRRPALADQKERADAEEGRGEEPAEEVVDAEGGVAPPRGRSPGQGRRREGIRASAAAQAASCGSPRSRQRRASMPESRSASSAAANARSASMVSASVNLRSHAGEAVPRHARPDAGAPGSAGSQRAADDPSPLGRLPRDLHERARPAPRGLQDAERRAPVHLGGTAAMESAVANVCSPGDRVLVVSHGYFGERWAEIAKGYGLEVEHVRYELGRASERRRGRRAPGGDRRRAGRLPHALGHVDGRGRGRPGDRGADRGSGALIAVDAISSLAAVPLDTDEWGFDIVLTARTRP